jgi:sugar phosphate permease
VKTSTKVIIAVLFCYLVAWLDRMAISMALPYIGKEFNLSATALGGILSAFFIGYAGCQIPGGWLADKFGARRVITGALAVWSLFTAFTGMVGNITQMLIVRFVFGAGEGVFPGPVCKIIGSWFSKKDRGTANSCVLTSTTLGPALTPLIVAPLIAAFGWRAVFYILGALGIVCVYVSWRYIVDRPEDFPGITAEEVRAIKKQRAADEAAAAGLEQSIAPKASFWDLIKEPRIWVMFFGVFFLTVPIWGYMTWLPTYLVKVRGLTLAKMSIAASIPFFVATVGMLLSGWMSDKFFRGRRRYLVIAAEVVGAFCLYLFYTTPSVEYATSTRASRPVPLHALLDLGAAGHLPARKTHGLRQRLRQHRRPARRPSSPPSPSARHRLDVAATTMRRPSSCLPSPAWSPRRIIFFGIREKKKRGRPVAGSRRQVKAGRVAEMLW